jgi:replicative DNA helicase
MDVAAERAVLAGIAQYGTDAYVDVSDILNDTTFTVDTHAVLYRIFSEILKEDNRVIDVASIFSKAEDLNVSYIIKKPEERRLISGILDFPIELSNVRRFASKIRKLQIGEILRKQLKKADAQLKDITGDEPIAQIMGIAENAVFDLSSLLNPDETDSSPQLIGNNVIDYFKYLASNPIKMIGISSGMKEYDKAIGGGFRKKTVNLIGSRAKGGKTQYADNVCLHVAGVENYPVLNLDTEMTKEDHWHRMTANLSNVLVDDIECGNFDMKIVSPSLKKLEAMPYYYMSIAGMPFEDIISIMRRWVRKYVGFEKDGTAKPCLIVYDYLKLMSSEGLSKDMKEYQLLGFQMTSLHNFMVKYGTACLAFIQLNRDGIEKEDASVASGSDRLIWVVQQLFYF